MKRTFYTRSFVVIAGFCGASCSSSMEEENSPSSSRVNAVLGGQTVTSSDEKSRSQTVKIDIIDKKNKSHRCGGVIFSNQWLLTAKHCVADPDNTINANGVVVNDNFQKASDWQFIVHANVDLALMHPVKELSPTIIKKTNQFPLLFTPEPVNQCIDRIYGFGCTGAGPTEELRKATMCDKGIPAGGHHIGRVRYLRNIGLQNRGHHGWFPLVGRFGRSGI